MFNQSNCGCNCGCGCNVGNNGCSLTPIMAPRKVCMSQSCRYVEQPIICPIECRHVENIVPVPRYYPKYEQTFVTQDMSNSMYGNGMNAGNGMGMPGNNAAGMNNGCGCANNRCGL